MTFLDLLIIYLSLGAPFGAYRFVRGGSFIGPNVVLSAATAFLLWPVYAVRLAFLYLGSSNGNNVFDANAGPDAKIVERIEKLSDEFSNAVGRSHRLVAKCAERSLDRYVELSLTAMTKIATRNRQYLELLTISGHPSPNSGTTCLNRRNQNVIERHLKDARNELLTALDDLSAGRSEAIRIVETIAELINDTELAVAVSANSISPREQSHTRPQEWETSKPQHRPTYNGETLTPTIRLD